MADMQGRESRGSRFKFKTFSAVWYPLAGGALVVRPLTSWLI